MLWDKRIYKTNINYGKGRIVTDPMHGIIQHLMVIPESSDTIWSMRIFDKDRDVIYETKDHEGRLDDREGLAIGLSQQEKFDMDFFGFTKNESVKVIIRVRESQ